MNSDKKGNREQVTVSLTSYPEAIVFVEPTVRSILAGSVLPDRIVLYLTSSQFAGRAVPRGLVRLAGENPLFEIRFYDKDIRSYTKLIPALQDFPDDVIVTVDDDQIYHRHLLRDLLKVHRRFPGAVVAHRVRKINPHKPYSEWKKYKWPDFILKRYHAGYNNLLTGVGGMLYPPRALKKEMLDEGLFMSMAPTTDDIWFWAAAVANGTKVMPVPFGVSAPHGAGKPASLSLMTRNYATGTDRNLANFKAIIRAYPDVAERLGE